MNGLKILFRKMNAFRFMCANQNKEEKKSKPDFDFSREKPVFIKEKGKYIERLNNKKNPKIAIQIHAFFMDVFPEIVSILNLIPYPYDCYITTDLEEKKKELEQELSKCNPSKLVIDVVENRGRDIAPFLQQIAPVIDNYEYIAHIHTKKSKHVDFGDDWRHFLYRNMFGSREYMLSIFERFEKNPELGLVIPEVYPIVRELMAWDDTKESVKKILQKMKLFVELDEKPICPVGDVFWARTKAVNVLFKQGFSQKDFQEEQGQLNYTLAHVIERIWCYLVIGQGYQYNVLINGMEEQIENENRKPRKRVFLYACVGKLTKKQIIKFSEYKQIFDLLIIGGKKKDVSQIMHYADKMVFFDENVDSTVIWECLLHRNENILKKYDEIILSDSNAIGPLFDIASVLYYMANKNYMCWSVLYGKISEALFTVFDVKQNSIESICEMVKKDSIVSESYIRESRYIGEWLFVEEPIKELSFDFIVLHSPYISKESYKYLKKNEKILLNEFMNY